MKCPVCGVVNSADSSACAQCKSDLEVHRLLQETRENMMLTQNLMHSKDAPSSAESNISDVKPGYAAAPWLQRWVVPFGLAVLVVGVLLVTSTVFLAIVAAQQAEQTRILSKEISKLQELVVGQARSSSPDIVQERTLFLKVVESLTMSTEMLKAERNDRESAVKNDENKRENYVTREKSSGSE